MRRPHPGSDRHDDGRCYVALVLDQCRDPARLVGAIVSCWRCGGSICPPLRGPT